MVKAKYFISKRWVIGTLLVIWFLLLVFHVIAIQIFYNTNLNLKYKLGILEEWQISIFDLDGEASFGTYFSSIILLFSGILIFIKYRFLDKYEKKWRFHWMILGIMFCLLSMEEIVGIHEYLNTFNSRVSWTQFTPYLLIPLSIYYLLFLYNYRGRLSTLLIISGIIYISGAVAIEYYTYLKNAVEDNYSLSYNMRTVWEEGMEMLGVILLINTMLDHIIGKKQNRLTIEIGID